MKKLTFVLMTLLVILAGCGGKTDSGTRSNTKDVGDVKVTMNMNNNTGTITVNPGVSIDKDTGNTKQDTANTAEGRNEVPIDVAGATEAGVATLGNATDVIPTVTKPITNTTEDSYNDNSEKPVTNNTTTPNNTPVAEEEEEGEEQAEEQEQEVSTEYETEFHHTQTGSSDGGKSLILCPGQTMDFDSCSVGDVNIPRHSKGDEGREAYWNQTQKPTGDIVCKKGDKQYKYRADKTWVSGDCS